MSQVSELGHRGSRPSLLTFVLRDFFLHDDDPAGVFHFHVRARAQILVCLVWWQLFAGNQPSLEDNRLPDGQPVSIRVIVVGVLLESL